MPPTDQPIEPNIQATATVEGGASTEAAPAPVQTTPEASILTTSTEGAVAPATDGGTQGGTTITTPPGTPTATSLQFPENWKQGIAEEFRNDPAMQHILDVPTLAKSYIHAQKSIGADKIPIPSKHATEADWQNVFQKLGLPENLDSYDVKSPEDAGFDDTMFAAIKETAYKSGILPHQLTSVLKAYGDSYKESLAAADKTAQIEQDQAVGGLKQEWGQAYDANVNHARHFVQNNGDEKTEEWLEKTGLGNNPMMIKLMAKAGRMMREDTIGEANGGAQAFSPRDAQQELNKILGEPKHPYYDANHRNHANAIDEVQRLNEMVHSNAHPGY